MQKFSKFLSICLAMALVFTMAAIVVAADEPIGSEENPEVVPCGSWGYEMSHVFDAEGTYWFTFAPEVGGLVNLTTISVYDADAADVTVIAQNVASFMYVEINNQNSSAPFTCWAGDEILIGITAPAGADVYVVAEVREYDDFIGGYYANINDYSFMAYVEPGTTITFAPPFGMGSANWSGMGLKVEGVFEPNSMIDPDPIPQTTVIVDGVEYKDLKNDSNIQLTMPISRMGSPEFSISYGMAMGFATYKVTFVNEELTECDHTNKTSVGATAPECHTDGILAHDVCDDCGTCFINGEAVDSVVDAAENQLEYIWRTVTCTEPGNITHYHCEGCGNNYDEEGNLLDTIASDELGHDMSSYEAQDPSCCGEGNHEWHYCNNCSGYFKDAEGNEAYNDYADIWIEAAPDAHKWVLAETVDGEELVDNVPAEHISKDLIYICECPSCWMINFADYTTTLETSPSCGTPEFVEASANNKAHYKCSGCGKLFADAEGLTELTEEDIKISQTGDESMTVVFVLLAFIAVVGCVVMFNKKRI